MNSARRVVVLAWAALLLAPLVALVLAGFGRSWRYPEIVPADWTVTGISSYSTGLAELAKSASLSFGIGVAVAALACVLSVPAARVLGARAFRGKAIVWALALLPAVVPTIAVSLGLQVWFVRWGLAGSAFGVVLVQTLPAIPYTVLVLSAAFARFDDGYVRQARSLGATRFAAWRLVGLPLLGPALALSALFAFLVSWNDYILSLVIGLGQVKTLPIELFAAIGSSDQRTAASMAAVFSAPAVALSVVGARLATRTSDMTVMTHDGTA